MKKIILTIFTLSTLVACENNEPNTEVDTDTTTSETVENSTTEEVPEKENSTADRSTIEEFWKLYKKAILEEDYEYLKTLYAEGTAVYKFSNEIPEEYDLIKNSASKNITVSTETYKDKEVMSYYFEFPISDEEKEMGMEASAITVYMTKNENNEYEVFNVSLAG